jgi:hypothetical protein
LLRALKLLRLVWNRKVERFLVWSGFIDVEAEIRASYPLLARSSAVEQLAVNQRVTGSIPVGPANPSVAQSVEHSIDNRKVAGSTPAARTIHKSMSPWQAVSSLQAQVNDVRQMQADMKMMKAYQEAQVQRLLSLQQGVQYASPYEQAFATSAGYYAHSGIHNMTITHLYSTPQRYNRRRSTQ